MNNPKYFVRHSRGERLSAYWDPRVLMADIAANSGEFDIYVIDPPEANPGRVQYTLITMDELRAAARLVETLKEGV